MSYSRYIIVLCTALLASPQAGAQEGFSSLYPESQGTFTGCVGPDNTYLAAGQAFLQGGFTGAALVLVDSTGNVIKADTLTHPSRSLQPGLQGCAHFAHGHYWITGQAYFKAWVTKLTPNLDTVWSRIFSYQDSISTVPYGSLVTSSGDLLITGSAFIFPPGDSLGRRTVYLAKLDQSGNLLWETHHPAPEPTGQPMWQWGSGLIETPDGGYLIYGQRAEEGNGNNSIDNLLMKTDSLGNQQWTEVFGSQYSDKPVIVKPDSDTTFIAFSILSAPKDPSLKFRYYDGYLQMEWRSYADGAVDSSKILQHPYYPGNAVMSVAKKNNDWVILGSYYPNHLQPPDPDRPYILGAYMIKLSAQLDSLWYRELAIVKSPGGYNLLFDLRPTPDKGLVAFGRAENLSSSIFNLWIVKTDSMGCVQDGCHRIAIPEFTPRKTAFQVYPNPAGDYTTLEGPELFTYEEVQLQLHSLDGRLIDQRAVKLPYLYELSGLPPGTYLLRYSQRGEALGHTKLVKR